jgi:hypothetical protein
MKLAKCPLEEANVFLYFELKHFVEAVLEGVAGLLRTTSSMNEIVPNLAPERGTILIRSDCCFSRHVCVRASQLRVFFDPEVGLPFGTPARRMHC